MIKRSVGQALVRAIQRGNLPRLEHFSLKGCYCEEEPLLTCLFKPSWPTLTDLNMMDIVLDETSARLFDKFCHQDKGLKLPLLRQLFMPMNILTLSSVSSSNLTCLWQHNMTLSQYEDMVANIGSLQNVNDLGISMAQNPIDVQIIKAGGGGVMLYHSTDHLRIYPPFLTQLFLHNAIRIMYDLYMVTRSSVLTNLHKLDISRSSGITGTLSILLCHRLVSLDTLIMSRCGLNSNDLQSLAKANVKGRLQSLRHLDISQNAFANDLKSLFRFHCKWKSLLSLNIAKNAVDCFDDMADMVNLGCLGSLQKLEISIDIDRSYTNESVWPGLTRICFGL